jgi:uncharacterized protein YdeI (YjbR/CyaY-like superfamily)
MAKSASPKTFEAALERMPGRLNWIIVRIPLNLAKLWDSRGQIRVKGEINGFFFRTSLFPTGTGGHYLLVNKQMQTGGKAMPGGKARFRLEPDTEERVIKPPAEWLSVLRQSKTLQKFHDSLTYSTRRDIAKWIAEGKHQETRMRRAEQMALRLMETMEAERELPPVIQVQIQSNPKARAGWELMPPSHRRAHLLGIFGYRNPESRARRVSKAVQEMIDYAQKRGANKD